MKLLSLTKPDGAPSYGVAGAALRLSRSLACRSRVHLAVHAAVRSVPPFASAGEAVGQYLRTSGISHNPIRLFPTSDVGFFGRLRLATRRREGGTMKEAGMVRPAPSHPSRRRANDRRRQAHCCGHAIERGIQSRFLSRIASADLESMDDWDQMEILSKAGVGALEIHNWIVARAAHRVVRRAYRSWVRSRPGVRGRIRLGLQHLNAPLRERTRMSRQVRTERWIQFKQEFETQESVTKVL